MHLDDVFGRTASRRSALKAGAAAVVASQAAVLEQFVVAPRRPAFAAPAFSDIQFDIGRFMVPGTFSAPGTFNDGAGNVVAGFGPIFTLFAPARLSRNPTKADQAVLANALSTIEAHFDASPSGLLIVSVSYGVPYFNRLPQALVQSRVPRLLSNPNRSVLEESPAFPTDVVSGVVGGPGAVIPNVKKDRFNVNVVIENNDILFQFRSDSTANLANALAWLEGSGNLHGQVIPSPAFNGLLLFQTPRLQFMQPGLPRRMADSAAASSPNLYEFHTRVNPNSPMVMGFADQAVDSSAPTADVVTFVGSSHARLTNARPGDYFDNGCIAHFSHVIDDLYQFYSLPNQDANRPGGEPFTERVQYMFRSNQLGTPHGIPHEGNADQFNNGGGPAFINNVFQGTGAVVNGARDAGGLFTPSNSTLDATFTGTPRVGHEAGLQRVSRAADGTPLHIRNDGPGFDAMDVPAFRTFPGPGGVDVPAGSNQFKLQFIIFVPTSEFFRAMRVSVAAQDLQHQFLADQDDDNGLERFITATRRQNFLVPPRRHRSFPLLELT
jgi:hypothetical protein